MKTTKFYIGKIPVIIWGVKSGKAYIYVHGKMSDKESAETFARIAENKGYQTISFDLPEHGERKSENYRCDIWNGISDLHQITIPSLSAELLLHQFIIKYILLHHAPAALITSVWKSPFIMGIQRLADVSIYRKCIKLMQSEKTDTVSYFLTNSIQPQKFFSCSFISHIMQTVK